MSRIEFESIFPEDRSSQKQSSTEEVGFVAEFIDLSVIKQTHISTNALYNIMLSKGLISRQEYHAMKQKVQQQLYPDDFSL